MIKTQRNYPTTLAQQAERDQIRRALKSGKCAECGKVNDRHDDHRCTPCISRSHSAAELACGVQ